METVLHTSPKFENGSENIARMGGPAGFAMFASLKPT
jgi:hypothetical protein